MPPPPSLLYVVKQLELATRARLDEIVRPAGITALQYTALTVLERRPSMTSADLARHSFVRAQSTADLVGVLESRSLISRGPDPAHKRRLLISLTPSGRELLRTYSPQVARLEEEMLHPLDQADRNRFRDLLESCRRALASPGSAL